MLPERKGPPPKKRIPISDQDLRLFDIVKSAACPKSTAPEIIVLSSSDDDDDEDDSQRPKTTSTLRFSQVPTDDETFVPLPSRAQRVDSPPKDKRRRRKARARSASVEALVLTSAPPRRHIPPALNAKAFGEESAEQKRRVRDALWTRVHKAKLIEASGSEFVEYAKQQWFGPPKLLDAPAPASLEEYIGLT